MKLLSGLTTALIFGAVISGAVAVIVYCIDFIISVLGAVTP
jgi:hypothetical protein